MGFTAIMFALWLAACAGAEPSAHTPPPLDLNGGGTTVSVPAGGYVWSFCGEDGTISQENAWMEPPLQGWEDTPRVDAGTVSLHFQGEPDRVTVQRWEMDRAVDEAQPETLPVRVNIVQDTVEWLLDLEPGSYGYAVTLCWEESETQTGSAAYYFHTGPER